MSHVRARTSRLSIVRVLENKTRKKKKATFSFSKFALWFPARDSWGFFHLTCSVDRNSRIVFRRRCAMRIRRWRCVEYAAFSHRRRGRSPRYWSPRRAPVESLVLPQHPQRHPMEAWTVPSPPDRRHGARRFCHHHLTNIPQPILPAFIYVLHLDVHVCVWVFRTTHLQPLTFRSSAALALFSLGCVLGVFVCICLSLCALWGCCTRQKTLASRARRALFAQRCVLYSK